MWKCAAAPVAVAVVLLAASAACSRSKDPIVTVGAKKSPEQQVLGEILAQHLEHRLGGPIARDFGGGSTMLTYQNLLMGAIDLYPEYTGDIVSVILGHAPEKDPTATLVRARNEILQNSDMQLLGPLGFEHSFVLAVRTSDAKAHRLEKISDLENSDAGWTIGVPPEFQERSDGYQALMLAYNIEWKAPPRIVDPGQQYALLARRDVDMIAGRNTDGGLAGSGMTVLKDDRDAFPPSQACILVRKGVFARIPALRPALEELSGKISQSAIQHMTYEVEERQRPVQQVAAEFLQRAGL